MQHVLAPGIGRRLLTTGAAVAGCSTSTVRRAIEKGELPAYRLGPHGDHRIRAEALDAWLEPTTRGENDR